MTTDGLSLEQVQQQWRDSQALIDDLRVRLQTLASASTSAAEAAARARETETTLTALASAQSAALEAFQSLKDQAEAALAAMRSAVESSDTGQILGHVTDLGGRIDRVADSAAETAARVERFSSSQTEANTRAKDSFMLQGKQLESLQETVEALRKSVPESSDLQIRLQQAEAERDQARQDLKTALSMLPGRYANKVTAALGSPS